MRRTLGRTLFACIVTCFTTPGASAQTATTTNPSLNLPVPASHDGAIPTLHVYTNLLQVPTLVLSALHTPLKPLKASQFRLTLDSGPEFTPTYVRVEGDDPISLAIFIDLTSPKSDLLPPVADAIAAMAPLYLHAQDQVSVYSMDCDLIRAGNAFPADPGRLRRAAVLAMQPWSERRQPLAGVSAGSTACPPTFPLWDSLVYIIDELSLHPGRRVLLAITDGHDSESRTTWKQALMFAQKRSVAVFGLSPAMLSASQLQLRETYNGVNATVIHDAFVEDPFHILCELSGGIELHANGKNLEKMLQQITTMVRGRYILEFPRGNDFTAGLHSIEVSIPKHDAYIRPAGITFPLADPKLLADPTTLPANPALAPTLGQRRILQPSSQ